MQTKVAFTMLVCSVYFSPRSSKKNITGDAYEMVMELDEIGELNFEKFVYEELMEGAKKVQLCGTESQKKFWIYGCLLWLQVMW
jgi:hypothetical protein